MDDEPVDRSRRKFLKAGAATLGGGVGIGVFWDSIVGLGEELRSQTNDFLEEAFISDDLERRLNQRMDEELENYDNVSVEGEVGLETDIGEKELVLDWPGSFEGLGETYGERKNRSARLLRGFHFKAYKEAPDLGLKYTLDFEGGPDVTVSDQGLEQEYGLSLEDYSSPEEVRLDPYKEAVEEVYGPETRSPST
ncbi:MAG: twin-arginine translocation signal domain-containing protein [Candidatus Nanohalobium sp.]